SDQVAPFYLLAYPNRKPAHVAVKRLVAVSVIDDYSPSIPAVRARRFYLSISGRINRRADGCCKVDTRVHFPDLINRMYPCAETRDTRMALPAVNRLDGWNAGHHFSLGLGQFRQLVVRFRLHIQCFGDVIKLFGG